MYCPVCQDRPLKPVELMTGLYFRGCDRCGGHWLPSFNYWQWRAMQGPDRPTTAAPTTDAAESEADAGPAAATDNLEPKGCPECGLGLVQFEVGHGIAFLLDHCGVCGGTWFDADEFEMLHAHNLHDDIHAIFMATWQQDLDAARAAAATPSLEDQVGADAYRKVQRFRAWLDGQPRKNLLMRYLNHE